LTLISGERLLPVDGVVMADLVVFLTNISLANTCTDRPETLPRAGLMVMRMHFEESVCLGVVVAASASARKILGLRWGKTFGGEGFYVKMKGKLNDLNGP
jgi:hypothetical protein